ncbi:LPXTG cell wall anchor domain-containing protein [Streptomyces sp. H10-C2]|uniref:LPXTG cell wall anchor domain-containing protein n=1 Tax=unclassified Streptomyces TaxID=2593676 RepID=UPI0024B9F1F6|nr:MULTISPECIES: LPXTG cell wall anchor domain-containing protein [unclassified Streptomyces]MDJ0341291.1 LPXTG cell wall anchor domain-containing protein [Streptomyces sp. PH10-H1]MDJ0370886.1 LPXTG cell wall anchor domain-containing protein [Streptomyces sp. H10-C2]
MKHVMNSVLSRTAARGGVLLLATATAAGAALLVAPAAHAETVDVAYSCQSPIGKKDAVSPIDITSVASGSGYTITMSFQKGVSSSPIELGKGAMNPSATIILGGADSGSVSVAGAPNGAAIPANTPIKINDLTGTYTPKKSGKVTFTAGVLIIKALGTVTTCNATNSPKPSLSMDVKAAGGGSATTPPGNDSTLPQTGPADSAVALGTFGGTVLLAGVAGALWLTRRAARTH